MGLGRRKLASTGIMLISLITRCLEWVGAGAYSRFRGSVGAGTLDVRADFAMC